MQSEKDGAERAALGLEPNLAHRANGLDGRKTGGAKTPGSRARRRQIGIFGSMLDKRPGQSARGAGLEKGLSELLASASAQWWEHLGCELGTHQSRQPIADAIGMVRSPPRVIPQRPRPSLNPLKV